MTLLTKCTSWVWYLRVYRLVRRLDRELKSEGIKLIYERYYDSKSSVPEIRPLSQKEVLFVQRTGQIIERVCFHFLGQARCLHRSLAGYHLFLQRGLPIDLVVGVMKKPFMAHAWLEYNGNVINDNPDAVKDLTVQLHTGKLRYSDTKGEVAK